MGKCVASPLPPTIKIKEFGIVSREADDIIPSYGRGFLSLLAAESAEYESGISPFTGFH